MRKYLTLLLFSVFAALDAQTYMTYMKVLLKDGTVTEILVDDIQNISWTSNGQQTAGHDYVDLGLPSGTLWATCNVGASKPEEYGEYYAWGETETKSSYGWSNYKWHNNADSTLTKYCTESRNGIVDNKVILDADDDVACVKWGGDWHMPTQAQQLELLASDYTTTEWITHNNVRCLKVTSKSNGNYILLPAAGERFYDRIFLEGEAGFYWSRSLYDYMGMDFYAISAQLRVDISAFSVAYNYRNYGQSVRPVLETKSNDYMIILLKDGITEEILVSDIENITWETRTKSYKSQRYVDLGLQSRTLWATCNLGADSPEEFGDYFAWGETSTKSYYYCDSYKWAEDGDIYDVKKYNTDPLYGVVDNKTELEVEDDAAYVNLGSDWRMPSYDQMSEIYKNCVLTIEFYNGKKCYNVIGPNGNNIFLPLTGGIRGSKLYYTGSLVDYLCRDTYKYPVDARCLTCNGHGWVSLGSIGRVGGNPIRPIYTGNKSLIDLFDAQEVKAATVTSETESRNISRRVETQSDGTHEYVDLGLPSGTLWATCNVGANSPVEGGDYFAWGETAEQTPFTSSYYWYTYKFMDTKIYNGTQYGCNKYTFADGQENSHWYWNGSYTGTYYNGVKYTDLRKLELEDDVAHVNWGGDWVMPTNDQMQELLNDNYTTSTWTVLDSVKGLMITSKSNGNYIFLPAASNHRNGSYAYWGLGGYYWTSELSSDYSYQAYSLYFSENDLGTVSGYDRNWGHSVRPVMNSTSGETDEKAISMYLSSNSAVLTVGNTLTLMAAVYPSEAAKNCVWLSSDTKVATVSDGVVKALTAGTTTITYMATDGSGVKATCEVLVINKCNDRECIDLGLPSGTLWATCNLGADCPEDYGSFYAWGETSPRGIGYTWEKYSFSNGSSTDTIMTKYCTDSKYGNVDNKTMLDPEDDAAQVNWGGSWRMPTKAEIDEIVANCTWTWTRLNGVVVLRAKGPNGNSIFLPYAGYNSGDNHYATASAAGYWSSELSSCKSFEACVLYSNGGTSVMNGNSNRHIGRTIRPVCDPITGPVLVSSITLDKSSLFMTPGDIASLKAEVLPDNADDKSCSWSSSNKSVATVDANGKVTAINYGDAVITCTANDGSGVKTTCTVNVPNHVDLGLTSGTLWGVCNVGASKPEECGLYFAWGETTGYGSDTSDGHYFDWANYKWMTDGKSTWKGVNKYTIADGKTAGVWYNNGTFVGDNLTSLLTADDAAKANNGKQWQIPSDEQMTELRTECYWEWTSNYKNSGVAGFIVYKVKSDSDKGLRKYNGDTTSTTASYSVSDMHIFLPAGGFRIDDIVNDAAIDGYYWSSTLYTYSYDAYALHFKSTNVYDEAARYRYYGLNIRPIYKRSMVISY